MTRKHLPRRAVQRYRGEPCIYHGVLDIRMSQPILDYVPIHKGRLPFDSRGLGALQYLLIVRADGRSMPHVRVRYGVPALIGDTMQVVLTRTRHVCAARTSPGTRQQAPGSTSQERRVYEGA